jgi:hypothetical protein
MNEPHKSYAAFLESLTPETLANLKSRVTENVRFKDPFNDVRGADAMIRVFKHMFANVSDIHFRVADAMMQNDLCLMRWRLEGRLGGKPWILDGASAVRFAPDGRVSEHIDYWDAAGDFYERIPVIGWLLALIRRRLRVH